VLQYGQSEYVRQFGMHVEDTAGALTVKARVLEPPKLKYGPGSAQMTIVSVTMRLPFCVLILLLLLRNQTMARGICACCLISVSLRCLQSPRIDKRFFKPATIEKWIVVIYERQQRFTQQSAQDMIDGMLRSFKDVG